jgi:hypothetical protein
MLLLQKANEIMFNALIPGSSASGTKLDTAYIEYVNGDAVAPPEIGANEDSDDYYTSLSATQDRDYLRVPIMSHKVSTSEQGRPVLTVIVATEGDTGIHGKPFSATVGSRVYGIAIAASQANDRGDILFSRHYYQPAEQQVKPDSGSIMLSVDFS